MNRTTPVSSARCSNSFLKALLFLLPSPGKAEAPSPQPLFRGRLPRFTRRYAAGDETLLRGSSLRAAHPGCEPRQRLCARRRGSIRGKRPSRAFGARRGGSRRCWRVFFLLRRWKAEQLLRGRRLHPPANPVLPNSSSAALAGSRSSRVPLFPFRCVMAHF